ncbi:MAG: SRPBCC domain-containing protein [Bacteroidales bacterium]|nr:SRPBCC domain-containing protein [Bacteroidales bacterium]
MIKQNFIIRAKPEEVFQALTNPLTIELWSGYPAQMEASEGFEFSIFEGNISGKNLKIIPGRQLVQEWYFGDGGEQSVVTINLTPLKNRTKVELVHTNVPDAVYEEFEEGWRRYYWGAIIGFYK